MFHGHDTIPFHRFLQLLGSSKIRKTSFASIEFALAYRYVMGLDACIATLLLPLLRLLLLLWRLDFASTVLYLAAFDLLLGSGAVYIQLLDFLTDR